MKRSHTRSAAARRVRTALALVVIALAGIVWWVSRGDPPAAQPEVGAVATASPVVRSTTSTSTPELELDARARAVAPARITPVNDDAAQQPPIDSTCATIEVHVSVGKRVEEVANFACRFLRLSDSTRFDARTIGAQLSYCLPLARAHDEVIVSVTHERLGTGSARARVSYGSHVELHLRLPGDGKVRGFVLDEKRDPIADAWVFGGTLQRMRDASSTDLFEPLDIDRVDDAVITDAMGAFELSVREGCVTAWHDGHTSATVPSADATCIVLRSRGELRVQILDDAAEPWARESITLDGKRADTTDLLGRVFFKDVELGSRGLTLPGGRLVGVVHASPHTRELVVGPWVTGVSIRDLRLSTELGRAEGEETLVGTARESLSIVPLHASSRDVTIDAILPGPYTLVTKHGSFMTLVVEGDGSVVVHASKTRRTSLRVEAPMGAWVYITPDVTHEHLDRVCRLANGQLVRGSEHVSWSSIPYGRWRVVIDGACEPTIVDVNEPGQTVTLR
ncbi:MAG: hypothetical protein ACKVWV_20085 [Planctomycetota bacterium]